MNTIKTKNKSVDRTTLVSRTGKYVAENGILLTSVTYCDQMYPEEVDFMEKMLVGQSFKIKNEERKKFEAIGHFLNRREKPAKFAFRQLDKYNMRIFKIDPTIVTVGRKRRSTQLN